jgi:hypothetical protein
MKKYWLQDAPNINFAQIEVLDWLQGYGQVMSIAERDFIRLFGDLINNLKIKIRKNVCQCGKKIGTGI